MAQNYATVQVECMEPQTLRQELTLKGLRAFANLPTPSRELRRLLVDPKPNKEFMPFTRNSMIVPNGSANVAALRTKFANPIKSEGFYTWVHKQQAYIAGLSNRDKDILKSYTNIGDTLVNNFSRGTLRDLTELFTDVFKSVKDADRLQFLAYYLQDQMDEYSSKIDLVGIHLWDPREVISLFKRNIEFFAQPENIAPLLAQYRRDLIRILTESPRLEEPLVVYRGFQSESHLDGLEFTDPSFVSTSLSITVASTGFAKQELNAHLKALILGGVYEITVGPDIPCIFMPPISRYPLENEIVLAPGLHFSFDSTVHLKYRSMNAKRNGISTRIAIIHTEVRADDEIKMEGGGRMSGRMSGRKGGRKTRKMAKQPKKC